ncbi:MAG: helix-turn-helix transcriptional regulator [Campylobacterales bacterium]|nr:helix-turn-helix transcriptional regulator [Campylobacterales bacterium]
MPIDNIEKIHKTIGLNVQKIRKSKNISQLKLSLALGYESVSLISCAEIYHNKIHFNIEQLVKIAYILDVDICEFFKDC